MAVPSLWVCVKLLKHKTFSKRLLARFKMSGKIKPNDRQDSSVMNVPYEKKVLCEVQALFY